MTDHAKTAMPIVILAAGRSRRMRGIDKLMQDVDGEPLIRRQAEIARAVTSGDVIVALPPAPHPRYDALRGLEVICLPIAQASEGMNASLREAFAHVPRNQGAAMLVLADLPELTENDLNSVLQAVDINGQGKVWRGATQDGDPGHPIVFSADLLDAFADLHGDGGAKEIIAKARGRIILVPLPDRRARRDLDTPEEWAAWRAHRKERPPT